MTTRIYLSKQVCDYFEIKYDGSDYTTVIHHTVLKAQGNFPQIENLKGDLKLTNYSYGWFYVEGLGV